jgi:hypothetical protein
VLRLLAALGVLTEPQPRSFGLTIVGDRLRSDVPASMRNWAMLADTVGFGAHEPILGAVRTGKTGTEIAYGMTAWSVPAFMDTGLGCQLTELPIS